MSSTINISIEYNDIQAPARTWRDEDTRHSCWFCEHRDGRDCFAFTDGLISKIGKSVFCHVHLDSFEGICDAYGFNNQAFFDEFGELPSGESIYAPE